MSDLQRSPGSGRAMGRGARRGVRKGSGSAGLRLRLAGAAAAWSAAVSPWPGWAAAADAGRDGATRPAGAAAAAPAPGAAASAAGRPAVPAGALSASPGASTPAGAGERFSHGRFESVAVLRPAGTPSQVVLMLSDEAGWDATQAARAQALADEGALVAGIDWPRLRRRLAAEDSCFLPDGDFENLSHHLQGYAQLPTYLKPVLAGSGQGAAAAYAVIAQTTGGGFGGLATWAYCPALAGAQPLCRGEGTLFQRSAPGAAAAPSSPPSTAASASNSAAAAGPGTGSAVGASASRRATAGAAAAPVVGASATSALSPSAAAGRRRQAATGTASLTLLPAATLPVPWFALDDTPSACAAADARAFVERVPGARWLPAPAAGPDPRPDETLASLRASNLPELPPAPPDLADLPMVELPLPVAARRAPVPAAVASPGASAAASAALARRFVVLLSGDGGWAQIDKALADAFVRGGLPVAGVDSLRYFWTKRTPDGLAADLDRILRFYATRWGRSEAVLVGYSQGADVLPFALNRLPPATRARVRYTALLGLSHKASFEFKVGNWLGASGDHPIGPEARRLRADETLCLHGSQEKDSLCPELAPAHATEVKVPGDHHFDSDYEGVAQIILRQAAAAR